MCRKCVDFSQAEKKMGVFYSSLGGSFLMVSVSEFEKKDIYMIFHFSQHEEMYVCLKHYKEEEHAHT